MTRKGIVILFACLMAVSMFAPFVAGTPATSQATGTDEPLSQSLSTQPHVDPAPVDQSLQEANGTVEVVVRAEEFEVPDGAASATSGSGVVDELKGHAEESQAPILDYAASTDGVEVLEQFWLANAVLLELDAGQVDVQEIAALDGVSGVHGNFEVQAPEPASDGASSADYDTTYGLDMVNATEVWDEYDTMGGNVSVAVLDTGVDPDHPDIDIADENWAEFDHHGNRIDSEPYDSGEHGTHTSGTVSGGNASGEYIGVAPGVELMHGKVLDAGTGTFAQAVAGMEWAVEADADVVSMSLGADDAYIAGFIEPVRNARDAGTFVVASSGNSGDGITGSPGNVYDSFSVGAANESGGIASFSSGEVVDTDAEWGDAAPADWPAEYVVPNVAAPGVAVKSAEPGGGYRLSDGTSMAAPHVAGVVALMVSAAPGDLDPETIEYTLEATAWKPAGEPGEPDTRYGHGIVDAKSATDRVAADNGLTGTVTGEDGEPIEGATITLGGYPRTTNASGAYLHRAAPGTYDVTVEAFGYESVETTVTVEEGNFTELNVTLSPTVDARTVAGQPDGIGSGESFETTTEVANLDSLTVEAGGDYEGNLTLWVNGDAAEFGEPYEFDGNYSGEVTIKVGAADGTKKNVELTHTYSGLGDSVELTTGPTYVVAEYTDVAVVDRPDGAYGSQVKAVLEEYAHPRYSFQMVTTDELLDAVDADAFDVYVVQHFGEDGTLAEEFVAETDSPGTGVVLLDQYGSGSSEPTPSNAITQLSRQTGDPTSTGHVAELLTDGLPDVQYTAQTDHPILDGVAAEGETVAVSTPGPVPGFPTHYVGFHSYFEEYDGVYDGVELATVSTSYDAEASGTGMAADPFSRTVLASSLGVNSMVTRGMLNDAGGQLLANAVAYASDEPPVAPSDVQAEKVEPGDSVTVTLDAEALEKVKVGIANASSYDESDLSLYVDGEVNAFDEWRYYDDEKDGEYTIQVDVHEDAGAGTLSLDHTFVAGENDTTLDLSTGPTAVYEGDTLDVDASGDGDVESIANATDYVEEGGEIVVHEGDYYENEDHRSGSEAAGVAVETPGVTLRAADGDTVDVYYDGDGASSASVVDVVATDVHVDGLRANVENGSAEAAGAAAIRVNAPGVTVTDVAGAGTFGVVLEPDASDVRVDGVRGYGASTVVGTGSLGARTNVTITNVSVGAPASGTSAAVLVEYADDVTVAGNNLTGLAPGAPGILAAGSSNVTIADNVVRGVEDADAIKVDFARGPATVANNTVDDVGGVTGQASERPAAGVSVDSGLPQEMMVTDNRVTNASSGLTIDSGPLVTVADNTFSGGDGITLTGFNNFYAETVQSVTGNDLSGADTPFHALVNVTDGGYGDVSPAAIDARLNYVGDRNGSDAIAAVDGPLGEFVYQPYLTATPSAINGSPEATPEIGIDLHLDAGEMYGVGVPGPSETTIAEMFDDDFVGVVYGFDAASQSWTMLTGDDTVDSLNAMVVVAETDTRLTLDFQSPPNAPPAPGTYELRNGWNLVTAPGYIDAEDAFGSYIDDNQPVISTFTAPEGQFGPEGELDSTYLIGSGDAPNVSAFEGYFVFSGEDGEKIPTRFAADPTADELYDDLDVSDRFHDGETGSASVEDVLANADEMPRQVARERLTRVVYEEFRSSLADADDARQALNGTATSIAEATPPAQRDLVNASMTAALERIFVSEFGASVNDDAEDAVEETVDRKNETASESVSAPTAIAN